MKRVTLAISLVAVLIGGCELPEELNGSEKSSQLKTTGENSNLNDRNLTQEMIDSGNVPQRPGGQSSQQDQQIDQSELDFRLRGACAYYDMFYDRVDNKSWFNTYGTGAYKVSINLVGDDLSDIKHIVPDQQFYRSSQQIYEFIKPGKENADLLRTNTKENIVLSCIHKDTKRNKEQIFHELIPLDDMEYWKKRLYYYGEKKPSRNDSLFYVSFLSDLHYKIYKKNYEKYGDKDRSLKEANDFMQKAFPGAVYQRVSYLKNRSDYDYGTNIAGKGSIQSKYYKKLNNLAWDYTDKRVDLLNDLIADNYASVYLEHTGCQDQWVCSAIFPDLTEQLIRDPEFHEGLAQWKTHDNLIGNATGYITKALVSTQPKKYNIKLSLTSSHGSNVKPSYMEVYQNYYLKEGESVDDFIFKIKSNKLIGYSHAFGGFEFGSGLPGYEACFYDGSDTQLGCFLVVDYSDWNTLPIVTGEQFKVVSTQSIYFAKGSRDPFEADYNLGKMIDEHLPAVRNVKDKIAYIQIGAFAGETLDNSGDCIKCESRLEAEEISLEKLR